MLSGIFIHSNQILVACRYVILDWGGVKVGVVRFESSAVTLFDMQHAAVLGLHKAATDMCARVPNDMPLLDMKHTAVVGLHKQERVSVPVYQMPCPLLDMKHT